MPHISHVIILFRADVFEYELNNPMALYGSVPYMLAHNENIGTVGVFLNNAAEMWIDITNSVSDKGVMSKVSFFFFVFTSKR